MNNLNESSSKIAQNSMFVNQGSKWKTGLNRFKNNVSSPTLVFQSQTNNSDLPQKQEIISKKPDIEQNENNVLLSSSKNEQNSSEFSSASFFNQTSKTVYQSSAKSSKDNFNFTGILRPKTQFSQNDGIFHKSQQNKTNFVKFDKMKTQPIFLSHHESNQDRYRIVHKSFDAHFKRKKEITDAFKEKDWKISERLYRIQSQKAHQLINWKELNPAAKVPFFTDNHITEEVLEETKREKKLNDLPDDSCILNKRFRLPPERQMTGYQHNRVYFWG